MPDRDVDNQWNQRCKGVLQKFRHDIRHLDHQMMLFTKMRHLDGTERNDDGCEHTHSTQAGVVNTGKTASVRQFYRLDRSCNDQKDQHGI